MLLKNILLSFCFLVSVSAFSAEALRSLETLVSPISNDKVEAEQAVKLNHDENSNQWFLVKLWSVDCGICRAQVPVVSKLHDDGLVNSTPSEEGLEGYRLSVLGVAIDSKSRNTEVVRYLKKSQPSYPNVIADGGVIALWFGTLTQETFRGTPTYLLFDPDGELAAIQTSILKPDSLDKFISRYSKS